MKKNGSEDETVDSNSNGGSKKEEPVFILKMYGKPPKTRKIKELNEEGQLKTRKEKIEYSSEE